MLKIKISKERYKGRQSNTRIKMAQAKRKKKFFNVEIPLIKKRTQLQAYEVKELEGRFIKYDLTRILKGKATIMTLKTKVKGEEVLTSPKELRLLPYYLRRMVRRGTNYVEDSFSTKCKDSQIRIKPFLVTRRKVSRAVRKALRNKAKEELISWAKESTTEKIFDETLKGKIQRELSIKLKKIYPLSLCEIRILNVEKEKKE
ncbi:hypothetical protein COT60_00685 [Candidatus Pacearchaeota archaeon CG09_land_8_20_14_0_10_30_9]|nr:MAG: hypothetical protein COV77_01335 [Candidatus Pacearchaeota archaeon CG11_big_fil_rev_8_21_14_0_20_30_13]PIO01398.1 MAG: hypothetical protein COT60_00685 [Candidatus Pacearchaeota archaeon CG09_land_8_20_14_0_10_30_9]PIZ81724.1 MAG: hypothetical protein COX98_02580 [Candidatus Pacearchaeota archaeon CG_4_10_14_0_2_um_filter_30_11]PJA71605.1 MAG: hypothetical protein CO153_00485 [Candidatus Pacearchaeota archaeon CG_4_9_14_3_um_filter_30_11]